MRRGCDFGPCPFSALLKRPLADGKGDSCEKRLGLNDNFGRFLGFKFASDMHSVGNNAAVINEISHSLAAVLKNTSLKLNVGERCGVDYASATARLHHACPRVLHQDGGDS